MIEMVITVNTITLELDLNNLVQKNLQNLTLYIFHLNIIIIHSIGYLSVFHRIHS